MVSYFVMWEPLENLKKNINLEKTSSQHWQKALVKLAIREPEANVLCWLGTEYRRLITHLTFDSDAHPGIGRARAKKEVV